MQNKDRYLTAAAVAGTVVLWASAFVGIRAALADYSPFHLALLRFLVASLFLAVFAALGRVRWPAIQDLPRIIATGFFGIGIYNLALNYGAMTVSAGSTSFIISTAPIMTALLSIFFLGEKINRIGWAGMLLSFCGVNLIAFGEGGSLKFETGAVFVFFSAICTSIYFVIQKPLLARYGSFEVASYSIWVGTAVMLTFLPGLAAAVQGARLAGTLTVVYLGVFPAALAYFFWAYVLARFPASRSVSFLYLIPVVATLLAYLILHEMLSPLSLTGGGLSLTGVIILNRFGKISAGATAGSLPARDNREVPLEQPD